MLLKHPLFYRLQLRIVYAVADPFDLCYERRDRLGGVFGGNACREEKRPEKFARRERGLKLRARFCQTLIENMRQSEQRQIVRIDAAQREASQTNFGRLLIGPFD